MELNGANSVSKDTWARHGEVNRELRGVVERIGSALLNDAEIHGAELDLTAELELIKPVVLPIGSHLDFPPSLFGGLANPDEPNIPAHRAGRLHLANQYQAYVHGNFKDDLTKVSSSKWLYLSNTEQYPPRLIDILDAHNDRGVTIDPEIWSRYAASGRQQLQNGRYDLEIFVDFRYESLKAIHALPYNQVLFDTVATSQHADMLYALSSERIPSYDFTPADYLAAPIGDYGEPFAKKMLAAMSYLQRRVGTSEPMKAVIADEASTHEEVLQIHTARSRTLETRNTALGLPNTEREGIVSTTQTAMLLTSERIEGYETGESLLVGIVEAGLIEQFARAVPAGFIATLTNTGRRVPDLVMMHKGKLSLNPEKMEHFKRAKKEQLAASAADWAIYDSMQSLGAVMDPPAVPLGLVCPAAMPHGAIANTGKAITQVLGLRGKA